MGRKSNRAKEKKLKKKEDDSREAAMWAVIDAANSLFDPMESLQPFKTYSRNGIDVSISCQKVSELGDDIIDWAYQLTKSNMQSLYEASEWGWNDEEKKKEMTDKKAWYLLARDTLNPASLLAVCHFRFDVEDDVRVLYCYEIQLCEEVRRKGLGKFLMQILELIAFKTSMEKVMLTVFRHNVASQEFFVNKLKYSVDETSPVLSVEDLVFDDLEGVSYEILSKPVKQAPPTAVKQAPPTAIKQTPPTASHAITAKST